MDRSRAVAIGLLLAAALASCELVKPGAKPPPFTSSPTPGGPAATASPRPTASPGTPGKPETPGTTPTPRPTSPSGRPGEPTAPGLPVSVVNLAPRLRDQVAAARTTRIRVEVRNPGGRNTLQRLSGVLSVGDPQAGDIAAYIEHADGRQVDARILILPAATYVALPATLMPPRKSWVRIGADDPPRGVVAAATQARDVLRACVTSWDLFRHAVDRAPPRWETLDGTRVAHYAGTVDTRAALTQMDSDVRGDVLKLTGPDIGQITWDLWVSERALPVQYRIIAYSASTGQVTAQVSFADWGVTVSPRPPAARDTVSFATLDAYLNR